MLMNLLYAVMEGALVCEGVIAVASLVVVAYVFVAAIVGVVGHFFTNRDFMPVYELSTQEVERRRQELRERLSNS